MVISYIFNMWPFTPMKILTIENETCLMKNKYSKIGNDFKNFAQSGEILTNLATLLPIENPPG